MRWLALVVFLLVSACSDPPAEPQAAAAGAVERQSELEKAVEFVRTEAIGATGVEDRESAHFRLYAGLSAMSYLQTNMSSARYSFIGRAVPDSRPSGTEACLLEQQGTCGNHVAGFLDILGALGIPVRQVQIYYEHQGLRQSHTVAEVQWDDAWHMFDVTWGFLPHDGEPLKALSYRQARARGTLAGWHNQINPWRASLSNQVSDLFSYLTARGDVVTDGNGIVHPYPIARDSNRVVYGLAHIPRYVGSAMLQGGHTGEVVYSVTLPDGFDTLTLVPSGIACTGEIVVDDIAQVVSNRPMKFSGLEGTVQISTRSSDPVCYIVLEELYATDE